MLSRFTSLLHNAVEALAPEMSLLEQFRYHWKCVTQFFLDSTDERMSVESTSIPHHLEQMIEVLRQEEQENGVTSAGPSMEFMLQHKLLETMQTLGKADCPPGMKRQVLMFFTNLLGKSKQQLLPHVNVHKPVNKLIRCCGKVKAAPTESEEVQFLLQVSSKLKQDPHLVNFFLEKPSVSTSGSSPPLSPGLEGNREKPEYSLVDSLLSLTKSEDSRVAIKACEGLLLCTSILEDNAACVIVLYTAFCERMADQLSRLFKCLPAVIDPADMNQLSATWGFDHEDPAISTFPGKRQMIVFFSWLDYVNQLSVEAHPMVAKSIALAIRERFIQTAIEPGLSQASEPCAITVTAVLTRCLKLVTSSTLAREFADILLGMDNHPEDAEVTSPHKLRRLLIQRINHLSDQLAIETLRLFQALLHLAYQPILDTLVTRNFKQRNYLDLEKYRLSQDLSKVRTSSVKSNSKSENDTLPRIENTKDKSLSEQKELTNPDFSSKEKSENIQSNLNNNKTLAEQNSPGSEQKDNEGEKTEISLKDDPESTISNSNIKTELLDKNPAEEKENRTLEKTEIPFKENTSNLSSFDNSQNSNTPETPNSSEIISEEKQHSEGESADTISTKEEKNEMFNESVDSFNEEINIGVDYNSSFNKRKVEKAVNGFLLILPDTLRTSEMNGQTGYDSYLRDAHKQCEQRSIQSFTYEWPSFSNLDDDVATVDVDTFYEGAFLHTVMQRLQRMLEQPLEINLEVTAILSLLCQFQHPYLHEFMLDTSSLVKDKVLTPHRVLQKVCQDLKVQAPKLPNLLEQVNAARKNLTVTNSEQTEIVSEYFIEGVIVLEEFCKELAAIAFVSATMQKSE